MQTVELLKGGEVVATARTDAGGVYGFVLDTVPKTVVDAPEPDYLVRLRGGVTVPAPVSAGKVARVPTLTRSWYTATDMREDADERAEGY